MSVVPDAIRFILHFCRILAAIIIFSRAICKNYLHMSKILLNFVAGLLCAYEYICVHELGKQQ